MNKQRLIITCALTLVSIFASAQERFFTKTGMIKFFSKTDLENIDATNTIVTAVLDTKSGAIQFSVPMKAFEFKRALMQEHFNENYIESDKFPNSSFRGKVINNADIKYGTPGTYTANIEGDLTIHGVSRSITTKAKLVVGAADIAATTAFSVLVADFNISIPSLVADKISKSVQIEVHTKLQPLTK
jgi:polyisoprenoid-binding protein YceI